MISGWAMALPVIVLFMVPTVLVMLVWAVLHVRKSVTTWGQFDKIEARLTALEKSKFCQCEPTPYRGPGNGGC